MDEADIEVSTMTNASAAMSLTNADMIMQSLVSFTWIDYIGFALQSLLATGELEKHFHC